MSIKERKAIEQSLIKSLKNLGVQNPKVALEYPEDIKHGDYSTNVALAYAKELKMKPKDLGQKVIENLVKELPSEIKVEMAGAGFINFRMPKSFFIETIRDINKKGQNFGKNSKLSGKKIIVEYTDPNPFKELHIGHFMSNSVGEAISRIIEVHGAETKRACYQGDVGMHVAKAVWAMGKIPPIDDDTSSPEKMAVYLGKTYAFGAQEYEVNEVHKKEIVSVNKSIYEGNDNTINNNYDLGRKLSLEYFDSVYKKLGTHFDFLFFESNVWEFGKKIVFEFLKKGIFEESEKAVVFRGEKYDSVPPTGLHTRVFINSEGLPTYEAKELGLAKIKYDTYPYDFSIVITGNDVNDYFKVILAAMKIVFPDLASKTKHISHGTLRLPTGKMSSRKGNVITAIALIEQVKGLVNEKIKDRGFEKEMALKISEQVAIGALRYSILKQSPGSDIIYDFDKSVSFEGDSGPYLQYSCVRAKSVLEKAKKEGLKEGYDMEKKDQLEGNMESKMESQTKNYDLEKVLYRFPEIVERAGKEFAPHHIATYLIQIASIFNHFYATETIVKTIEDGKGEYQYKVALTRAFSHVMENGLKLLGIEVPEKM